jgi:hypothetical protein
MDQQEAYRDAGRDPAHPMQERDLPFERHYALLKCEVRWLLAIRYGQRLIL